VLLQAAKVFNRIVVMKIPTILLIFVMFFGIYFIADANAYSPPKDPSLPQINLQLVLRNSQGQLVSYFETDYAIVLYPDLTHEFLDSVDNKISFVQDGKTYERIQWQKTEYFDDVYQPNIYALMYNGYATIMMYHGPYLSERGDSITVYWDIIRILP